MTLEEKDYREYHNNEDSHRDQKRGPQRPSKYDRDGLFSRVMSV